jgi:indolepyruvate ferredoxin oxidoreductase alpha subunit
MKMSGVNVALDSLASIAYSGTAGGLVIYVADDPGASAGMVEQDSRSFAAMCDLPMLEAASVAEAYRLVGCAFELSERAGAPVFLRLVAAIANSYAAIDVEEPGPLPEREPMLVRDIARYTKAGAAICTTQHREAIARLERAGALIAEMNLNRLSLARVPGGLGIIASGAAAAYLEEGFEIAARYGFDRARASVLRLTSVHPLPAAEVESLLGYCGALLILEELEPFIEKGVYVLALRAGFRGEIIGKLNPGPANRAGPAFSRSGEYGVGQVVWGIAAALDLVVPPELFSGSSDAETLAAARPITVCAGCPHRGTFMAINQALKKAHYKPDEVMVTGDIGCTILGMNPPFYTVWNEVAMGASLGLAQGYVQAGVRTPVIATIGDSTFFHAGLAGLINAVQRQAPLTLIIMDNGWTAMTGMQVNPGTAECFQCAEGRRVDIAQIVPALGVEHFFTIDPFELDASAATIRQALELPGVKVLLARRECAIQAMRRGVRAGRVTLLPEKCNLCKLCVSLTGCAALSIVPGASTGGGTGPAKGDEVLAIDPALCYGCGLCVQVCKREALVKEALA